MILVENGALNTFLHMSEGVNNDFFAKIGALIRDKIFEVLMEQFAFQVQVGKMIDYDYKTRTATIQPVIKPQTYDGEYVEPQPISQVPVIIPSSSECVVNIPFDLSKPQEGLLIPTQISFGNWFVSGGIQQENIQDRGPHNCFFIPIVPNALWKNIIENGDDYVVKYLTNTFAMKKDGGMTLIGKNIDILQQLKTLSDKVAEINQNVSTGFAELANAQYGSIPGPTTCKQQLQDLSSATSVTATEVQQISTNLDTAQGNA